MRSITHSGTYLPLVVAALLAVAPLAAQQVPADAVLSGFVPSGDYLFTLDGQEVAGGQVFFSERAVSYLVVAPGLPSPLLVSPRTRLVENLHMMKLVKKDDGSVDVLADAVLNQIGTFRLEGKAVVWSLDGKTAKLEPRPWLLGEQSGDDVLGSNPEYARKADLYSPRAPALQTLRAEGRDVLVRVYFGSWCPVCKRLLPNILRVGRELEGSKVRFEYYGLPQPMTDDPETSRANVNGVPTAVVFVDGQEAQRLSGHDLNVPELSLSRVLGGS